MKQLPTKSIRMWIARDENNSLYLFRHKPYKSKTARVWTSNSNSQMNLDNRLFPSVKWENDKPTRVSLRLV